MHTLYKILKLDSIGKKGNTNTKENGILLKEKISMALSSNLECCTIFNNNDIGYLTVSFNCIINI